MPCQPLQTGVSTIPICRICESRADILTTVGQRKDFSRVCERHWTFSRGIKGSKQEDEEGNDANAGRVVLWDPETETSSKQSPRHLREGEDQEGTTAVGIDGPDGRECKKEVDQTKPP